MNLLDPLSWAILLMLLGGLLAISEVFIPSGGILGLLSIVAIVTSIALAFYHHGPGTGLLFSAIAVIGVPVCMGIALKYWPKTSLGKRFISQPPSSDEVLPDSEARRQLKALVGRIGRAKCDLLPAGAIEIDGQTIDALTQGQPVDQGRMVKVVEVKANRVVVRPLEDGENLSERDPNDVLSQPLESLGLDALEEPFA
jgi:membrane-bound ClpP family serine protease